MLSQGLSASIKLDLRNPITSELMKVILQEICNKINVNYKRAIQITVEYLSGYTVTNY